MCASRPARTHVLSVAAQAMAVQHCRPHPPTPALPRPPVLLHLLPPPRRKLLASGHHVVPPKVGQHAPQAAPVGAVPPDVVHCRGQGGGSGRRAGTHAKLGLRGWMHI